MEERADGGKKQKWKYQKINKEDQFGKNGARIVEARRNTVWLNVC